ncbi:hypothetical protein HanRHA438_Chr08g0358281 [Helianthus annuus]|nr:hypothetical protein HanIR_Chr08g0373481 [Helianthus annuus]KAJ0554112.1 hypothetical protein HanHA89_Chr08g0304001 [Helianthus annuus]KAJ0898566.1 hypothetical protein HanRHA438_Chr08g0358281 [Helianthus annuus]
MVMQQMENAPGGCLNVTVELAMVMILSVKVLVVAIGELIPMILQSNLWSFGYLDVLSLKTTSEEFHTKILASIFSSSSVFTYSWAIFSLWVIFICASKTSFTYFSLTALHHCCCGFLLYRRWHFSLQS